MLSGPHAWSLSDGGFRLTAPPAEDAVRILSELLELYRAGMRSPLPLPAATSRSYAKRRAEGKDVASSVRATTYASWQRNANDRAQAEIVALWGPEPDISVLLEESARTERELVRRGHPVRDARPPPLGADPAARGQTL